jgi:ferredoxin
LYDVQEIRSTGIDRSDQPEADMGTSLYYFSGTGNALTLARKIQTRIDGCDVTSIPGAITQSDTTGTTINGDRIGIVAPIYMHNMPHIVSRFVDRIGSARYLFFVFAGGGDLGRGVQKTRNLFARRGHPLAALFNVPMPSNYAPYGYPDVGSQQQQFADADAAVDRIVATVTAEKTHFDRPRTSFIASHLFPGPLYHLGYRFIPKMDGRFIVEDQCTRCGICEQVCPVGNITLQEGRPVWNHRCEQCYACLQWCPVEAIQYGTRTKGVTRYHHPDVTVQEMIAAGRREG